MAGEGLPVEVACRVLCVSCAGYYAWRLRAPSARALRHAWLTDVIREVHAASYGTYGAKRVHAELILGRAIRVGHNAVAMLMRRAGIQGRTGSPKRRGLSGAPTADDLVERLFVRKQPNQLWVTDITEHPTREGKVYCAVVLDAFVGDRHHRAPHARGQGVLRRRARRVQPTRRRLVDRPQPDSSTHRERARDGN